jgi:hypothetical protein
LEFLWRAGDEAWRPLANRVNLGRILLEDKTHET